MSSQPSLSTNVSTYQRISTPIPTLQSLPNFQKVDETKIDLSNMKIQENEIKNNDEIRTKHCEDIYNNLSQNVKHSFFNDQQNKDQIMGQLKQQIDYIYSRRYAKRRVG